jgi:outer membrane protein
MGLRSLWIAAALAAAAASSAAAETLDEALSAAYASSRTLAAKRAELRVLDEAVPQAKAGWRPSVTLTAEAGRARNFANDQPRFETTTDPRDYKLVVTQPLWLGGRTEAQVDQAEAQVMSGRAALAAAEQSVLLDAAAAYLDAARDQEVVALSIENERALERQLDSAKDRFRVGSVVRADVKQAEARLAQASADRASAEASLEGSRAAFLAVVGREPEAAALPGRLPATPTSLPEARELSQSANPTIAAADWAAKATESGVEAAAADLRPSVSLQGSETRALDEGYTHLQTRGEQAMLVVSVPLYEGGGAWARVRGQKQAVAQRRMEADQARRDADVQAIQAWRALAAAASRARSFTAQVEADRVALEGVEVEAKAGSRTVLDVLNAEQELFSARASLATARHDEALSAYKLRAATGGMTAEALGLGVERYDPAAHYEAVRGKWIGAGD